MYARQVGHFTQALCVAGPLPLAPALGLMPAEDMEVPCCCLQLFVCQHNAPLLIYMYHLSSLPSASR